MIKRNWFRIVLLLTLMIVFPLIIQAVTQTTSNVEAVPAAPTGLLTSTRVLASSHQDIQINEVMYNPDVGNDEWVEIKNAGASSILVNGFGLTDEDDNWYFIPAVLPAIPSGGFVVVVFDGLGSGSDDYDFSDDIATLHSPPGLVDVFEDDVDQVALYRFVTTPQVFLPMTGHNFALWDPVVTGPPADFGEAPLLSFVAWGDDPAEDGNAASDAGVWPTGAFVGTEIIPGGDGLLPDGSLGHYREPFTGSPIDWVIYKPGETSQGAENPLPAPYFRNPPDGIVTDDHQITFGWSVVDNATSYHLQVDNDPGFGSPEIDVQVADPFYQPPTPLADGTFYFRVQAEISGGGQSGYSPVGEVTFITITAAQRAAAPEVLLAIVPQLQHKDTNMLDLEGDPETGQARWDSAHENDGDKIVGNGTPVRANQHDNMYCTRASVSMIVKHHGGDLFQDRISYFYYGGGPPEGDLGNGRGAWPNGNLTSGTGRKIFDWAMNGNAVTSSRGKPDFDTQVKTWINAGRPLLIVENNDRHSVVLDGFLDLGLWELARRVDPWTATSSWVSYDSWNISEYHVAPTGVTPRSNEDLDGDSIPDTIDDSDSDGVSDFDERNRFPNLNYLVADTDMDQVEDQADIREYVFDLNGNYSWRNPDVDGDGARKEVDPDNDYADDSGADDGCEDVDFDGKLEPASGETDNFKPSDDMRLHIRLTWPLLGSDVDLHLIKPGGSYLGFGDCYYFNKTPDWGVSGVTCDNPMLDQDCTRGCTIENIRLSKLENGSYQVKVHYYDDWEQGPTTPRVTIWFQGNRTDYGPMTLSDEQIWDVATITWPSATITENGTITQMSGDNPDFVPPDK
jgi:hypothetical protein